MAVNDPTPAIRRTRVSKPPLSSSEIVAKVEQLVQAKSAPKASAVLSALRAPAVSSWHADHVGRLTQDLATIDPDWWLRLQVLVRGLPSKRGDFPALLHRALIELAQRESSFPTATQDEGSFVSWAESSMAQTRKLPALLFAAMWSARKAPWHPTASLAILRAWAGPKTSRSLTSALIASRIASSPAGQKRAQEIATLLQSIVARQDQAIADARTASDEAERARRARFNAEDELRSSNTRLSETNEQLAQARARIDALVAELDAARTSAEHDLRALRTEMGSESGKLRARVLGVLRHELQQTRLYLDRTHPNIEDALARLGHIDALRAELEQQTGDVRAKSE